MYVIKYQDDDGKFFWFERNLADKFIQKHVKWTSNCGDAFRFETIDAARGHLDWFRSCVQGLPVIVEHLD